MTSVRENHRPLLAGIGITTSAGEPSRGTLTGVARKYGSSGERLLVTCLHIPSYGGDDPGFFVVEGNEWLYQGGTGEDDKVGRLRAGSYIQVHPYHWRDSPDPNPCDLATVVVEGGVSTGFTIYQHIPGTEDHALRPIVKGAVEPRVGMDVTILGSSTGKISARITHTGVSEYISKLEGPNNTRVSYLFGDVVYLDRTDNPGPGGDSGAPCLWEDEDGNYRMCCILFAGKTTGGDSRHEIGYAYPASVAESLMGMYFGVRAPTAIIIGGDRIVSLGKQVTLVGSQSRSNERTNDIVWHRWERKRGVGSEATYELVATTPDYSFMAPNEPAVMTFRLTVADSFNAKHSETITVTVLNRVPTAEAGEDQTVYPRAEMTLMGSGTDENLGETEQLTYLWTQTSGIDVTLSDPNVAQPTFTAPPHAGILEFQLTVTDPTQLSATDTVTVTVPNQPPIAVAGPDKLITVNNRVTLEGSVSDLDPDDRASVTHTWSQDDENPATVTLVEVAGRPAHRTFTPTLSGEYTFTLTATDQHMVSVTDEVEVRVIAATTTWADVGDYDGCGPTRRALRARLESGELKTRWFDDPEPLVWGAWQDTSASHRNEEPGDWRDSGRPTYALGNTWQTQERTVTFDKQQTRTSHCNNMQTQWNPATKTERRRVFGSGWPISRPPTPTGSQWTVRHLDNKLQVKVTSLPTVTSSIIEVRARLEGGSTSDRAKVIKPIGTTLNTWVTVLSSSDDRWREGAWVAKIRFENSEKNSNYSTTKLVTAPTTPTTPVTPPITPPVTPPLPPPTNVSATATARSVTVSWSAVSDATGYVVEIGIPPSAGGLSHTSDPTTGTSITISNLLPWTTYEYRVKATAEGRIGTWSGWATVVTPKEDPLTPTNDQWDIEYDSDNNKIQAKVISLPAVIPAISEARVSMEIGQPPNPVTVTKAIGVSLGTWVDVLTSADTEWQSGTWAAHLRFENSVGNSSYSLPAKPVIVPTVPTTPPPIIDPDPWLDWTDALPPNNTRNEVIDAWTDTGNQRENQILLIMEKEQTRTITWEKRQERTSQSGNRTESRWVDASRTETQWVEIPPPCTWADTGQTRVDRYGSWSRTGRTRGSGADREREEERTVYREKQQSCTTNANTRYRWVSTTSTTETQWVADPVDPPCGPWSDTGNTRTSYGTYSRTGTTRGSGSSRQCEESRTNATEKEQRRTCDNIIENRWVSTGTTTQTQWVDCPEEEWPSTWTDTGSIENFDAGTWRDLSTTQGCGPDRERKQIRIATWRKEQFQTSNLGNRRTRWVSASRISFRWRDYPEALRWGSWTDTGQQRENQVLLIIEKEQERTSHCGDTQTRWVYVSG